MNMDVRLCARIFAYTKDRCQFVKYKLLVLAASLWDYIYAFYSVAAGSWYWKRLVDRHTDTLRSPIYFARVISSDSRTLTVAFGTSSLSKDSYQKCCGRKNLPRIYDELINSIQSLQWNFDIFSRDVLVAVFIKSFCFFFSFHSFSLGIRGFFENKWGNSSCRKFPEASSTSHLNFFVHGFSTRRGRDLCQPRCALHV